MIADLSLILQPNSSHLYLNKQVAIRNDFMLRKFGLKEPSFKAKGLKEVKLI
jgi:hypothetical protein